MNGGHRYAVRRRVRRTCAFALLTLCAPAYAVAQAAPASAGAARPAAVRTMEAWDPELARSIARVAVAPTAENHRRAAAQYLRVGVTDAAYEHYMSALRREPTDGLAHAGLSTVWRIWGFDEQALAEAYRSVYFAPGSVQAGDALGAALVAIGYIDAARAAFEEARRRNPTAAAPLAHLCGLALDSREVDSAIAWCLQAVSRPDAQPDTHALLGLAYARKADFAHAHQEFLQAGTRAEAAYELGKAYLDAGRRDDAARAFRSAVVADPGAFRAARQLRRLVTGS